jgi:methylenetetrahydrofolate--tRNA-(uracil-5-)-methyltransferase
MNREVTVIGGGLAGCEVALQLATRGYPIRLIDQKPATRNAAQHSTDYCELVCSNSFRGAALTNAVGLLKEEMRLLGSHVIKAADMTRVPAGGALAVDRDQFSRLMSHWLREIPRIRLEVGCIESIPDARPVVIATGPLTADALAQDLQRQLGTDSIAYYDAIAPIVSSDSINWDRVFLASRWNKGNSEQDRQAYVNCPLTREEYLQLVTDLRNADKVAPHAFEEPKYFEGCLPVEVMAERGERTLAFGPLKPVGLIDPRTSKRPYAVIQLRVENAERTAYNIVGFQTRMTQSSQLRIIRSIPGLENAVVERYGSVHRNTFIDSPRVLDGYLRLRNDPGVWFAGQITGVEGYVESAACGLAVALLLDDVSKRRPPNLPPATTALGSLLRHLSASGAPFQPSNVIFAQFPPLPDAPRKRSRAERNEAMSERALSNLSIWWHERNKALTQDTHANDDKESLKAESMTTVDRELT